MFYARAHALRAWSNDTRIVLMLMTLALVGLMSIASVSSTAAQLQYGDPTYYTRKHIGGLLLAGIILVAIRLVPYRRLVMLYPVLYILSALATAATLSPWGHTVHGSARWLNLGFVMVQPSELLKMSTLVLLALVLYRHQYTLRSPASIALCACITGMSILLLLAQPDFGQAMTIALSALILLALARLPLTVLTAAGLGLAVSGLLLAYLSPYRLKRLLIFMDPWADEQGKGFQVVQSLIALGSGGLTGVGLGQSQQKYGYLPMQHTDFIAAALGEEFGFIGMLVLITCYLTLTYLLIQRAQRVSGSGSFVIMAAVILINIQALFHLGVVTSCLPPKGIGLPLVSYGSSSLLAYALLMATILAIKPTHHINNAYN